MPGAPILLAKAEVRRVAPTVPLPNEVATLENSEEIPSLPDLPPPSDAVQVAPPPLKKEDVASAVAAEELDDTLADEVAAILSGAGRPRMKSGIAGAPRANVVRLPSETWLVQACANLNQLPEADRVIAFQSILRRYKLMRAQERQKPR
jgi:hypothetical protein